MILSIQILISFSLAFAVTMLLLMNRELIKKKWRQFLIWRQEVYVKELRDNIVVTKRGLTHLMKTQAEQNRELIKMKTGRE